jgi:hypothetical protein
MQEAKQVGETQEAQSSWHITRHSLTSSTIRCAHPSVPTAVGGTPKKVAGVQDTKRPSPY